MRFSPEGSPYPFIGMVPQNVTETLLLEELRRKGGDVDYQTSFVSAHQQDDCGRREGGPQRRARHPAGIIRGGLRRGTQCRAALAGHPVRRG